MNRAAIVGVGHSKFGDRRDVNLAELAFEAAKPAFEDAGLTPNDVDFLNVGTAGGWYEEYLPAVVISEYLGLNGKGLVRCEAGRSALHGRSRQDERRRQSSRLDHRHQAGESQDWP